MEEYKGVITKMFTEYQNLDEWIPTHSTEKDDIQFFESDGKIKIVSLITCDFDRLCKLVSDISYNTRYQWDNIKHLQVIEEYENDLHIIRFNDYLGVHWYRKLKKSATILFKTCTHPIHKLVPEYAGEFFIYIKEIDETKCYISIITTIKMHREYEIQNIQRVERLSNDIIRFNGIYNPWKCDVCRKNVPAHELECRNCKKERYKRCSDVGGCYEAQRKNSVYCDFCKMLLIK